MARLRPLFPDISRAPLRGVHDCGDYVNVPFPIEAKAHKVPRFLEWLRILQGKASRHTAAPGRWWLVYCDDRRRKDSVGAVVVMSLDFAIELMGRRENYE